jgi:hypothetical protein
VGLVLLAIVFITPDASAQDVLINQVFLDEDISFVEIVNTGTEDVSLGDYHLSTSTDYPAVVLNEGVEVAPGDFLAKFPAETVLPPGRLTV